MADLNPEVFNPNALPPEYQAQIDALMQKQALARLLQQRAMNFQPPPQTGSVTPRLSSFAALANLGSELIGQKLDSNASQGIRGVQSQFQNAQGEELGRVNALPDEASRLRALSSSNMPLLQKMATALQNQRGKRIEAAIPVAGKADPNAALQIANTGEIPAGLNLPEELVEVNGQRVPRSLAGDFRTTYKPPTVISGGPGSPGLLAQAADTGKVEAIDKAPRISVSASSNTGENAFTKALGTDVAADFKTARTNADMGYRTKGVVDQLRHLDEQGVFSGPGANAATSLAGFASVMGIPVDQNKLANSEAYQKEVAGILTKQLTNSSLARSTTDKDLEMIQKSLPSLLAQPQTRQWLYQKMEAGADTDIARHKSYQTQLIQSYPAQKGLLTLNPVDQTPGRGVSTSQVPSVPVPPAPAKPNTRKPVAQMTLEEIQAEMQALQQGLGR